MSELRAFIEEKINTAKQEINKLDIEIEKKAAALIARKAPFEKDLATYQGLLREFDKANKPPPKVKP